MYFVENFDSMAKDFDTNQRAERAKIIADKIRVHILNSEIKTAIEYGCGTGLVGIELAPSFQSLLLIDSSQEMINQVSKKISDLHLDNTSTICHDLMISKDLTQKVDCIFMSLVLHHIIDTETIITRMKDLINEGGHLIIVDLNEDDGSFHAKYPDFNGHNGFNQTELINLIKRVGFSQTENETFYYGNKEYQNKRSQYSLFIIDAKK